MWSYVLDADTGVETRLDATQGLRPIFSPDGISATFIGVNAQDQWQPAGST